jgi:hypothetical protein
MGMPERRKNGYPPLGDALKISPVEKYTTDRYFRGKIPNLLIYRRASAMPPLCKRGVGGFNRRLTAFLG